MFAENMMVAKKIRGFILRAAFGGAIGGLLLLLISVMSYKIRLGYVPYPHLFIIQGIPMALFGGAIVGGVVGLIIWACSIKAARNLKAIVRAIIGVGVVLIASWIISLFSHPDNGVEPPDWKQQVISRLVLGVILGALPAIMARSKE
jgi:hypothetical protein